MIGRLYTWRGATWRLLARGEPFDRGPRRNVLLERVAPVEVGNLYREGRPWLATGERVVRPFRGLRTWQP